jgi:hypothetical protein
MPLFLSLYCLRYQSNRKRCVPKEEEGKKMGERERGIKTKTQDTGTYKDRRDMVRVRITVRFRMVIRFRMRDGVRLG